MNTCPCCSDRLLAHIYRERRTWFCSNCRQEMPNLNCYKAIKLDRPVKVFSKIAK